MKTFGPPREPPVWRRLLIATLSFVALVSLSASAGAQVRLVAHSDVPVFVGGGLDFEGPGRLRLASSLGVLPPGYVGLANGVLRPMFESDGYTPEVAALVRASIDNSTVWRTTVGWRPFQRAGFVLGVGYTLAGLHGEATADELLADGVKSPTVNGRAPEFAVSATVQMLHAEVGWTWDLPSSLWLRTGLGMGMTWRASTDVEALFTVGQPSADALVDDYEVATEKYLRDTLRSYVHPPHLSIAFGWWI